MASKNQGKPGMCVCVLSHQSCPTLCDPMDYIACQAPLSMEFSSKNTGVGHHLLLLGISLTQESNPRLLHWEMDTLPLSHLRSPG